MSKADSSRSSQDASSKSKPDTDDGTELIEEFISELVISNCTSNSVTLCWTKLENKETINSIIRYRIEMNDLSENEWISISEMHRVSKKFKRYLSPFYLIFSNFRILNIQLMI